MFLPPRLDSTLSPLQAPLPRLLYNEATPAGKLRANCIGPKSSAGWKRECPTIVAV